MMTTTLSDTDVWASEYYYVVAYMYVRSLTLYTLQGLQTRLILLSI